MMRRVRLLAVGAVAVLSGLVATGAPASASSTTALLLSQGTAFAVLGHSCGGIQEKAYANGFDATSGFPTGDVYLSTTCSSGGRGSHPSTFTAWSGVTWDFTAAVVSYSVLGGAPSVNPTFSAFDAHGNEAYNSSSSAYLTLATGFVPVPRVTGLSLTIGPASGGSSVTISGTGFAGATAVSFGGTPAAHFSVTSSTSISATTPVTGAGTVGVTVTNAGESNVPDANDQFTFVAAPVVSSVSPNSGPISGGTSVVVSGTGFSNAMSVSFGGNLAAFTVNGDGSITATSPGIDGPDVEDVQVTTAGGPSAISMADQFSYVSGCTTCSSLWFTSAPFVSASVGVPFSFSITTSGGTVTKITKSGALPKGVRFVSTGNGTATLSGTPVSTRTRSAPGTWSLNLKATSGRGAKRQTAHQTLVLTVD